MNENKARVAKRLQNMDLQRLSALTGIDVNQFKHAVQINNNIDFWTKKRSNPCYQMGQVRIILC